MGRPASLDSARPLLPERMFVSRQGVAAADLAAAVKGMSACDGERARSAVSKRIRNAVRKIEVHHPTLGYHLAARIRTGAQCVYVPDPERQ